MDLLKTILVYMSMVVAASVQNAPDPGAMPAYDEPTPTPYVQAAPTATPTATATPRPTPVPTIDITPNPEYGTLQVGDRGDEVRRLQEELARYGYYEGDIDGVYGNQTRRAVEQFQYQHGLSADGMAGRVTLTVLYESNQVRMSPTAVTPAPLRHLRSERGPHRNARIRRARRGNRYAAAPRRAQRHARRAGVLPPRPAPRLPRPPLRLPQPLRPAPRPPPRLRP